MAKTGRSDPDLFGGYKHYDAKGKRIGRSSPNLLGGYTDYDARGHKIGRTSPNLLGGYTHYDNKGKKIGRTEVGVTGYRHYDAKGKRTGTSTRSGFTGSVKHTDSQGCYIATCVYGSYDCPPVWTLRRFRDDTLSKNSFGRAFIRFYYRTSPSLVARFSDSRLFCGFFRWLLDLLVRSLKNRGFSDLPYLD